MNTMDPLTNIYTRYGFAAADTSVTEAQVTDASGMTDVNTALGVTPVTGSDLAVSGEEPGPDHFARMGDDLKLKVFSDPLFSGELHHGQPVQGFLNNCPLIAVLTAMLRVPQTRSVIAAGGLVRERVGKFSTFRVRRYEEYLVGEAPEEMPRLPGKHTNFEGDRYFSAVFFQGARNHHAGVDDQVTIWFDGHTETQLISPVFYYWQAASPPLSLFYAHSTTSVLYPSAIEKAYVGLKSGSGPHNYQVINDGLYLGEVMFEVCGYARQGFMDQIPNQSNPLLPDSRWKNWLKQNHKRPTVLASKLSKDSQADGSDDSYYVEDENLVVPSHAYPVIGYDGKAQSITVINVLKEIGQADRIVSIPLAMVKANFYAIAQGPLAYGKMPLTADKKKGDID